MKLTIVLEPQEEGGFTAYVPSLPGCISQGETKEEAVKNIKEAIELYLEADTNELIDFSGPSGSSNKQINKKIYLYLNSSSSKQLIPI